MASASLWRAVPLRHSSGQIVDAGSPKALIAKYGLTTLEDVFLDVARHGAREGGGA
jgi:hypothetical protein